MKHVMNFALAPLAAFAVVLFWFEVPAYAEQPTREALESAQTDGFGMRRGRRRAEEEWLEPNRWRREEFDRRDATAANASAPRPSQSSEETANTGTASSSTTRSGEGAGAVTSGSGSGGNNGPRAGKPGSGIVTGLGAPAAGGKSGHGYARGSAARSGIVTGAGDVHHGGRPGANGIVSAAGAAPSAAGAAGRPTGAGIVTGAGTVVGPVSIGAGKPGAGIVTGAGGPPGQANAHGRGRGGKH
jgi:hypothetical protein